MKRFGAAILAVLVAPALALAQHGHHGGAPAVKEAPAAPAISSATSSSSAGGPSGGPTARAGDPEDGEGPAGFHFSAGLDNSLGAGTFIDSRYYSSFGGGLSLSPSYAFELKTFKLNASASAGLSWEYTLPDSEIGRRFNYSDLRVGLAAPGLFKEPVSGIGGSVNFGFLIPITRESWTASTITSLSLGLGLSRAFESLNLNVGYRLSGGRHLHVNNQILVPASNERDQLGNLIRVCRTDETYCGSLGNNSAWSLAHGLNVGWSPTEKLSFSLGYNLSSGWKEPGDVGGDEYKPQALDANGNPVARDGMVVSNRQTGSIGASYSVTDQVGVSLSMATAGPTLTKDGKRVRFPWFDFVGPADSMTNFSLGVSASY